MRKTAFLFVLSVLLLLFSSCAESHTLIPDGGYDYTVSDGILLGYPIPMVGDDPMHLTSDKKNVLPPAFFYDETRGEFLRLPVVMRTLHIGGDVAAVRRDTDAGAAYIHFAADLGNGGFVFAGHLNGDAVVRMGDALYRTNENASVQIADGVARVFSVDVGTASVLYSKTDGGLYLYCAEDGDPDTRKISGDGDISDAWQVSLRTELHEDGTVSANDRVSVVFCEDGTWQFLTEDGSVSPCRYPAEITSADRCVLIRGSAYLLYGNDAVAYLASVTGAHSYDMDMGGLYRFRGNDRISADDFVLSQDGMFLYFYDVDYIYRFNFATGTVDFAPNEAPMFENTCLIHSMTAATDEIVVLSQSAAEHTEFVATVTVAAFEEDIPETREEEKIDLEPRR